MTHNEQNNPNNNPTYYYPFYFNNHPVSNVNHNQQMFIEVIENDKKKTEKRKGKRQRINNDSNIDSNKIEQKDLEGTLKKFINPFDPTGRKPTTDVPYERTFESLKDFVNGVCSEHSVFDSQVSHSSKKLWRN